MDSSEDEDSKKLVIVTSESDEENSNEPNAKRRKLLKRLNVTTHKCLSPQPAKDVSKTSCLVGVQDGCSAQSLDEQSVEHHQQRTLLYNRGTQSPLLVFVSLVEKKQGETTHRQSSAAEGKHGTLKMKFTKNRLSQPGVAGGNEPAWELEPRSYATIVAKPACAQANVAETASFEDCLPHCIDGPSPILALPSTSTSGPAIPSELCGSLYQPKVVKSRQPKPHSNVKQPDASLYHSTGVCLPNKASYVQPAEECANVEQNPVGSQTFATICSSVLSSLAAKCPASSNQSSALDSHTNKSLFDLLLKLLEVGLHLNSSDVDTSAVNLENVLKAYYERLEPRASFIKINEQKYGYLLDLLKLGLDLSQSSILYGWTKFISMVKVRSNGNKPCAEAVVDVQMGYLLKELQAALQRKPKKNMTNTILFNTLLTMLELGLQLGALSYQVKAASLDKVLKEYQAELNPKPTLLKGKVVKLCLLKDNVEEVQHYLPSDEIVVMRMAKFEHWLELLKLGIWLAAAKECALSVELDELLCKYKSDYTEREENLTKVNLGPLLTLLKKQLLPSAITRQKNDVNLYEVVEATPSEVIAELGQSLITVQTSSNYQKSAASVDLTSGDSSIIDVGTETQTVQVVEQADQDKGKPEPSGISAERFSFSDSNQPSTSDYRSTAASGSKPETAGSSDFRITSDKFALLLELIEVWLKLNEVKYCPVNLCELLSDRKKELSKKTKPVKMTTDQYDRLLGVLDTGLLLSDASFSKLKQAGYVQEGISKPHQRQGGKQFRLVNLALLLEDLETGLINRSCPESSELKFKCLNKFVKTELLRVCNVTGTNKGRITCFVVVDNNEEFASRKLPTYGNSVPNWLYLLKVGVHLTLNFEKKAKLEAWLQQCKIIMRSTGEKTPTLNLSYALNDIVFEGKKPATSLEKIATKVDQRSEATRKSASQCAAVDADLLNKFSEMVVEQGWKTNSEEQIISSIQLTKKDLQTKTGNLVQPCTTQCNPVNSNQKNTTKNPKIASEVQPQQNAVPTSSMKAGLTMESTASNETNSVNSIKSSVEVVTKNIGLSFHPTAAPSNEASSANTVIVVTYLDPASSNNFNDNETLSKLNKTNKSIDLNVTSQIPENSDKLTIKGHPSSEINSVQHFSMSITKPIPASSNQTDVRDSESETKKTTLGNVSEASTGQLETASENRPGSCNLLTLRDKFRLMLKLIKASLLLNDVIIGDQSEYLTEKFYLPDREHVPSCAVYVMTQAKLDKLRSVIHYGFKLSDTSFTEIPYKDYVFATSAFLSAGVGGEKQPAYKVDISFLLNKISLGMTQNHSILSNESKKKTFIKLSKSECTFFVKPNQSPSVKLCKLVLRRARKDSRETLSGPMIANAAKLGYWLDLLQIAFQLTGIKQKSTKLDQFFEEYKKAINSTDHIVDIGRLNDQIIFEFTQPTTPILNLSAETVDLQTGVSEEGVTQFNRDHALLGFDPRAVTDQHGAASSSQVETNTGTESSSFGLKANSEKFTQIVKFMDSWLKLSHVNFCLSTLVLDQMHQISIFKSFASLAGIYVSSNNRKQIIAMLELALLLTDAKFDRLQDSSYLNVAICGEKSEKDKNKQLINLFLLLADVQEGLTTTECDIEKIYLKFVRLVEMLSFELFRFDPDFQKRKNLRTIAINKNNEESTIIFSYQTSKLKFKSWLELLELGVQLSGIQPSTTRLNQMLEKYKQCFKLSTKEKFTFDVRPLFYRLAFEFREHASKYQTALERTVQSGRESLTCSNEQSESEKSSSSAEFLRLIKYLELLMKLNVESFDHSELTLSNLLFMHKRGLSNSITNIDMCRETYQHLLKQLEVGLCLSDTCIGKETKALFDSDLYVTGQQPEEKPTVTEPPKDCYANEAVSKAQQKSEIELVSLINLGLVLEDFEKMLQKVEQHVETEASKLQKLSNLLIKELVRCCVCVTEENKPVNISEITLLLDISGNTKSFLTTEVKFALWLELLAICVVLCKNKIISIKATELWHICQQNYQSVNEKGKSLDLRPLFKQLAVDIEELKLKESKASATEDNTTVTNCSLSQKSSSSQSSSKMIYPKKLVELLRKDFRESGITSASQPSTSSIPTSVINSDSSPSCFSVSTSSKEATAPGYNAKAVQAAGHCRSSFEELKFSQITKFLDVWLKLNNTDFCTSRLKADSLRKMGKIESFQKLTSIRFSLEKYKKLIQLLQLGLLLTDMQFVRLVYKDYVDTVVCLDTTVKDEKKYLVNISLLLKNILENFTSVDRDSEKVHSKFVLFFNMLYSEIKLCHLSEENTKLDNCLDLIVEVTPTGKTLRLPLFHFENWLELLENGVHLSGIQQNSTKLYEMLENIKQTLKQSNLKTTTIDVRPLFYCLALEFRNQALSIKTSAERTEQTGFVSLSRLFNHQFTSAIFVLLMKFLELLMKINLDKFEKSCLTLDIILFWYQKELPQSVAKIEMSRQNYVHLLEQLEVGLSLSDTCIGKVTDLFDSQRFVTSYIGKEAQQLELQPLSTEPAKVCYAEDAVSEVSQSTDEQVSVVNLGLVLQDLAKSLQNADKQTETGVSKLRKLTALLLEELLRCGVSEKEKPAANVREIKITNWNNIKGYPLTKSIVTTNVKIESWLELLETGFLLCGTQLKSSTVENIAESYKQSLKAANHSESFIDFYPLFKQLDNDIKEMQKKETQTPENEVSLSLTTLDQPSPGSYPVAVSDQPGAVSTILVAQTCVEKSNTSRLNPNAVNFPLVIKFLDVWFKLNNFLSLRPNTLTDRLHDLSKDNSFSKPASVRLNVKNCIKLFDLLELGLLLTDTRFERLRQTDYFKDVTRLETSARGEETYLVNLGLLLANTQAQLTSTECDTEKIHLKFVELSKMLYNEVKLLDPFNQDTVNIGSLVIMLNLEKWKQTNMHRISSNKFNNWLELFEVGTQLGGIQQSSTRLLQMLEEYRQAIKSADQDTTTVDIRPLFYRLAYVFQQHANRMQTDAERSEPTCGAISSISNEQNVSEKLSVSAKLAFLLKYLELLMKLNAEKFEQSEITLDTLLFMYRKELPEKLTTIEMSKKSYVHLLKQLEVGLCLSDTCIGKVANTFDSQRYVTSYIGNKALTSDLRPLLNEPAKDCYSKDVVRKVSQKNDEQVSVVNLGLVLQDIADNLQNVGKKIETDMSKLQKISGMLITELVRCSVGEDSTLVNPREVTLWYENEGFPYTRSIITTQVKISYCLDLLDLGFLLCDKQLKSSKVTEITKNVRRTLKSVDESDSFIDLSPLFKQLTVDKDELKKSGLKSTMIRDNTKEVTSSQSQTGSSSHTSIPNKLSKPRLEVLIEDKSESETSCATLPSRSSVPTRAVGFDCSSSSLSSSKSNKSTVLRGKTKAVRFSEPSRASLKQAKTLTQPSASRRFKVSRATPFQPTLQRIVEHSTESTTEPECASESSLPASPCPSVTESGVIFNPELIDHECHSSSSSSESPSFSNVKHSNKEPENDYLHAPSHFNFLLPTTSSDKESHIHKHLEAFKAHCAAVFRSNLKNRPFGALGFKNAAIDASRVTKIKTNVQLTHVIAWNPNKDWISFPSDDGKVRTFDFSSFLYKSAGSDSSFDATETFWQKTQNFNEPLMGVTTMDWSPDGATLLTGAYDGNLRFRSQEADIVSKESHQGPVLSVKWNVSGTRCLSAGYDSTIIAMNSKSEKLQYFCRNEGHVLEVDWLDDTTFATCGKSTNVWLLQVGKFVPYRKYSGHADSVCSIRWNRRDGLLASGSDDSTIKIWDFNKNNYLLSLNAHLAAVNCVRWSDKVLASASFDSTMLLWDMPTGNKTGVFKNLHAFYSANFSPDGQLLAGGTFDGNILVYDLRTNKLVHAYDAGGRVHEVSWNSNGNLLGACSTGGFVYAFDLRNSRCLNPTESIKL